MSALSCPLVWIVTLPPSVSPAALARCVALLDEQERARAAAFRLESPRQQYTVAHAMLRTLLSHVEPVPPTEWRFGRGNHGKSFVEGSTLAFSLSHTAGAVAVAISDGGPIGIDIEAIPSTPVDAQQFRSCLAANELAALNALPPDQRRQQFYELWVAKEAVAKAVGTGISSAMAGIRMDVRDGAVMSRSDDTRYHGWYLTGICPSPAHCCAVANRMSGAIHVATHTFESWIAQCGV